MSYRNLISCHVSDGVAEAFAGLARTRETTMAALLRDMIERELGARPFFDALMRDYILFTALALDVLLQANSDPDLRVRVLQVWRERIAALDGHES